MEKTEEELYEERKQMREGIKYVRAALSHMRRGVNDLAFASEQLAQVPLYFRDEKTTYIQAIEKARRSLAEAISELVRYDK